MDRLLRQVVFFCCLASLAAPAAALDPILMFVFSMAREMAEQSAARESAAKPLPRLGGNVPEFPKVYPGTMVEPENLRALIDDCFRYLSDERRQAVFDSLNAALLDPKNASIRAAMIDHFAERALAVRAAQAQLDKMSRGEKEALASEFRKEVGTLPPEEKARVAELLRQGLLPVPNDFSRMLLGAVEDKQ